MSLSITAYLRENASRYSDKESLYKATIRATGAASRRVSSAWGEIQKGQHPLTLGGVQPHPITFIDAKHPTQVKPTISIMPQGLNESQLRAKHDVKFIISNAAASLKKGIFLSDAEFIKLCNISSQQNFRMGLNDDEFNEYHGKASGVVYWSHPESIEQMKQESILR